jgi:hypothetical protein
MENNISASQQEQNKPEISFQHHLRTYVGMIFYFWILWFFLGWRYSYLGLPWPVLPMIGWVPALLIHYIFSNQPKK